MLGLPPLWWDVFAPDLYGASRDQHFELEKQQNGLVDGAEQQSAELRSAQEKNIEAGDSQVANLTSFEVLLANFVSICCLMLTERQYGQMKSECFRFRIAQLILVPY